MVHVHLEVADSERCLPVSAGRRLDGEAEADRLGDGVQGGEARVAAFGEGAVQALALDAGVSGDLGDAAAGFGDSAKGQVGGGKERRFVKWGPLVRAAMQHAII
jgi:hypothetical protein